MNSTAAFQHRHKWWGLGLLVLACYGLGIAFPEPFWGMNNTSMLPPTPRFLLLLVVVGLFAAPFWWRGSISLPGFSSKLTKNLTFATIAILTGVLCFLFPIAKDLYGDAIFISQGVNIHIPQWDNRLLTAPLQPDFLNSKVGLQTYYQLNNFLTWLFGVNGQTVTPVMEAVLAGGFAFTWLKFVDLHLSRRSLKYLLALVGLTTPLLQVFMAHFETYALSYLAILLWVSALGVYFKTENKRLLWALPFIFLLVLQTHITNWLLFPSLIMAILWQLRHRKRPLFFAKTDRLVQRYFHRYQGGLTWSGLVVYLLLPGIVGGIIVYFFLTENYNGPREFLDQDFENALFLPLFTDEPAPYDRYNLFSWTHLFDYFNLMFYWSGAALFLLIPPLTFLRKSVPWNSPFILTIAASALLLFLAFFVLNPLLALGIDWDLFSTPGLVVLPLMVVLYGHLEKRVPVRWVAGPTLGLCLLGASVFAVNATPAWLGQRLTTLGRWNFKTYWIGSSTAILEGIELVGTPQEQQVQRLQTLDNLAPHAIMGNDKEYAGILEAIGKYEKQENQDLHQALSYFEKAHTYFSELGSNTFSLTTAYFEAGNMTKSFAYVTALARMRYPPYKRTLRMGIHISLAAGEYQAAANYAVTYLNRWQGDPVITEVEHRLRTGDRIEELVDLFQQRPALP